MYTLQAIIANASLLRTGVSPAYPVVSLERGIAMIPLTQSVRDSAGISFLPLTDEGQDTVPASVVELCRTLSSKGRVAYVEAEITGGVGTQACVLADGGHLHAPYIGRDAINRALVYLGVSKGTSLDEFEAVGLGQHRHTDDWTDERGA